VARLEAKQQTEVATLGRYITAHSPCMVRLLTAVRAIFGPPRIFRWEGLSVRYFLLFLNYWYNSTCALFPVSSMTCWT